MRYQSWMNTVTKIIAAYSGGDPLAVYLKKYFAANKQHGSKDRKQIATLCYNFYRLGKALPGYSIEERIVIATFLCEQLPNDFLHFHKPEWNDLITKPLPEKISLTGFAVEDIFPWHDELSGGINFHLFSSSFFNQPNLFLRIRPGKESSVVKKLKDAGLSVEIKDENCIAIPNASKLDTIIELDREVVVQDLNSQQVLNVLKKENHFDESKRLTVWDCCAASGGKSILAYDIFNGKIDLTVSDIRESILLNLKKRFSAAGIKKYKTFLADLASEKYSIEDIQYSIVICDAPCTGSGTWSRTPEQICFFKEEMITAYANRQRKIVTHVIPRLQAGGIFIYITCSVFKKENEDIIDFIKEKFHLQVIQMELLKGYAKKADSMFVAAFLKK